MSQIEKRISKLEELPSVIHVTRVKCDAQEETLQALISKVDDIENRSRRCNLVFYGIEDTDERENNLASEKLVLDLCTSVLGVDQVAVERAHRLGKFDSEKPRPIIVNFSTYKERQCAVVC